jgi:hypothetical protein
MSKPFDFSKGNDDEFLLGVDADMNPIYLGSKVEGLDKEFAGTIVAEKNGDHTVLVLIDGEEDQPPVEFITDEFRVSEES